MALSRRTRKLISAGGSHPRYSRVLAKALVSGDVAVALIDNGAHGDHCYPEVAAFERSVDAIWREVTSSGAGEEGIGWTSGFRSSQHGVDHAYGVAKLGEEVRVQYGDVIESVPVQTEGWWLSADDRFADTSVHPLRMSNPSLGADHCLGTLIAVSSRS